MIVEIVILAMIAAFLGLRLYSVLGRRAEHEEEPVPTRFEQPEGPAARRSLAPAQPVQAPFRPRELTGLSLAIEQGLHVGRPGLLVVDIPATGRIRVSGIAVPMTDATGLRVTAAS